MFSEDQEVRISTLFDNLLTRMEFEVQKQAPQHLPAITNAVIILHGYKSGQIKMDEKHMMEITLLKNINNEVKDFRKGGQDGGNKTGQPPFPG